MLEKRTVFIAGATVLLVAISFSVGQLSASYHKRSDIGSTFELARYENSAEDILPDQAMFLAQKDEKSDSSNNKTKVISKLPFGSSAIADIAQAAAPAVVLIEVDRQPDASKFPSMFDLPFNGFENFEFFYNGRRVSPKNFDQLPHAKKSRNTGSGFFIRPDGYILTNAHVVQGSSKIEVTLQDKRKVAATVIGTDGFSDLAVVKVDLKEMPYLKMGSSSNLRPGEFAIAIGSPLGYDHTVTMGIISAVGRTVTDINGNINFIQTDAAINRGNSGGPLLSLDGDVIGVNTAIRADAQNIGFSIPVDIAKSVSSDLIDRKKIVRPWLGIGMQEVDETMAKSLGLTSDTRGVLVARVYQGSPADDSGIKQGDIIQKIDGRDMKTAKDIQDYVRSKTVKDTLSFFILREGAGRAFAVNIGEYPEQRPES